MAAVVTFYNGINPATQMGVQNVRGVLYMMSSEISFTVAYSVIYEFPGQVMIYLREGGVYSCGPYYIATFLGLVTLKRHRSTFSRLLINHFEKEMSCRYRRQF